MSQQTDETLDYNLRNSGFQQSSCDPNEYWRRNSDGSIEVRDTDGDWSKTRNGQWERDSKGNQY